MESLKLKLLKVYSKAIPSRIEIVSGIVSEIIQNVLESCKTIHDDILFELRVILHELIINAIIHGNKENKDKLVEINAGITNGKRLVLVVSDEGEGYDYNSYLKRCEKKNGDFLLGRHGGKGPGHTNRKGIV